MVVRALLGSAALVVLYYWLPIAKKAGEIYAKTLDEYSPPPLDDAVRAELDDYVNRRRAELGD